MTSPSTSRSKPELPNRPPAERDRTAPSLPDTTSTFESGAADLSPVWTSRPWRDRDRDEVLALFAEPDFYYRTEVPDSRPEWEILALLGDDTRLLFADGRLAGLYAVENEGAAHGSHFRVHLRLRAAAPLSWWCSAYQEVVAGLRWRQEVVRVSARFFEFDSRGLRVANALGLATEGTLADIVVHDGQRRGQVFFAQIWTPAS